LKWSIVTIYVDDCLHTYKGAKMRTELYGTLARAKLPASTVQQLTLIILGYANPAKK